MMTIAEFNATAKGFQQFNSAGDPDEEGVKSPSEEEFEAMRAQLGV